MKDAETKAPDDEKEVIVCRVTRWYFRRMGIMAAFLLAMGLYFFYDGKYGYPKDNAIGNAKEEFQSTYVLSFDHAKASGTMDQWIAQQKARGMPTGENGEPPKWASYAAEKGWPEEPKHHSPEEIAQQFEWGGVMILISVVLGIVVLLNKNKTFTGYEDHMVMPNGAEVRYAEAFKVDKRKWEYKGLAYVHYRHEGRSGRVTVDDLKFAGANRVLARLVGKFNGELIEKAPEEEAAQSGPPAPKPPA